MFGGHKKRAHPTALNGAGVLQWNTFMGSTGTINGTNGNIDIVSDITVDHAGNVFVAGYSYATCTK